MNNEIKEKPFRNSQVINIGQSGFKYEENTKRTLSFRGEKTTTASVKNTRNISHSYTIMPMLNMEGKILKPLLINFQEVTGNVYGPHVLKNLPVYDNVHLTCSKNGKLTSAHMVKWAKDCLKKGLDNLRTDECCLVLDSWSGHRKKELYDDCDKTINLKVIPAGATSLIQPCDLKLFQVWKNFAKRISEHIGQVQLNIDLTKRDKIVTMHSLILNQFQSILYRDMWIYAWYVGGYDVSYNKYPSINELSFNFVEPNCENITGDNEKCEKIPFIKCSHCRIVLCLTCFFTDYHYHDTDF